MHTHRAVGGHHAPRPADDAHATYGTACDQTLGDPLRVTVIATGLSGARKAAVHAQAAAKVEALSSDGMDEIEIPAFLRKQAD